MGMSVKPDVEINSSIALMEMYIYYEIFGNGDRYNDSV